MFSERPFALHPQQFEKGKQNVDVAPPGLIYIRIAVAIGKFSQ